MEVALGLGSLVLLVGGVTGMVRRDLRPSAAVGIAAVAAMVAVVALAGQGLAGTAYAVALIVPTTLGGLLAAVMIASRRTPRGRR